MGTIHDPNEPIPLKRKDIILQTRQGNPIANSQVLELFEDEDYSRQIDRIREKYIGIMPRPNTISCLYNCHGMTFASKRTGIELNEELIKIIKEDNYVEITNLGSILTGDLVLYFSEKGEIEHSGIVIKPPENTSFLGTATVLSKWGSGFEVIHPLYGCPYELSSVKFYRCTN